MTDYKHSKVVIDSKGVKRKYKIDKNWKVENVWRPTSMTEDTIKELERMFEQDSTVSEACLYAGISTVTYYSKLKEDKDFSNRMRKAQSYAKIMARKTLLKSINSKDEKVAQKWSIEFLKRRDGRYSDKLDSTVWDTLEREEIEEKKLDDLSMLELEKMRKELLDEK